MLILVIFQHNMPAPYFPTACTSCGMSIQPTEPRCSSCKSLRLDIYRNKSTYYRNLFGAAVILFYTFSRISSHSPMFSEEGPPPQNDGGAYQYGLRPEVYFFTHRIFLAIGFLLLLRAIYFYVRTSRKMGTVKWL